MRGDGWATERVRVRDRREENGELVIKKKKKVFNSTRFLGGGVKGLTV